MGSGWELDLMKWANGWWTASFLDRTIPYITYFGSHLAVVVFILVCGILMRQKKALRYLFLLYGIESGVLYGLKLLIQRQRPLHFLDFASKLSRSPGEILDPSFPSGHAVYAFMMATLLASWFPRYRVVFYLAAVFIGWTRVYLGLHFPSDVITGSLLGYGMTRLFLHWARTRLHPFPPEKP